MNDRTQSLHVIVEKWLGPAAARTVKVVRERAGERRCVRLEVARSTDVLSLRFFRHADGSWMVFPPERRGPCMGGRVSRI